MIHTGIIGHPVTHSLSPIIHHYWMKQLGIGGDYERWDTPPETLAARIAEIRARGIVGFNITVPHKQTIMAHLDEVDETAKRIGAVNSVANMRGRLIGINTDAYGFITNLKHSLGELEPYLEKVLVIGAGGAARAIIVALKDNGAKRITILNRTLATASSLAEEFHCETANWSADNKVPEGATLVVNTTVLGMRGKEPLQLDLKPLHDNAVVHDIVYAPLETELLREAAEQGYSTVDGLGMLLYQAQKAFALWHGIEPKVTGALRAHVLEHLS